MHGLQGQRTPAEGLLAGRRSRLRGDPARELQLRWDRSENAVISQDSFISAKKASQKLHKMLIINNFYFNNSLHFDWLIRTSMIMYAQKQNRTHNTNNIKEMQNAEHNRNHEKPDLRNRA